MNTLNALHMHTKAGTKLSRYEALLLGGMVAGEPVSRGDALVLFKDVSAKKETCKRTFTRAVDGLVRRGIVRRVKGGLLASPKDCCVVRELLSWSIHMTPAALCRGAQDLLALDTGADGAPVLPPGGMLAGLERVVLGDGSTRLELVFRPAQLSL